MGMSASQARLLSITARLSDNELRTQTITAAKTSLANKTSEASREYINALDEKELMFTTYDDNGSKILQKLTGTALTQYGILKNQYGLINPDGQIMVSEKEATNYLESANIAEFLSKYGFENAFSQQTSTRVNEGSYTKALDEYNRKIEDWQRREPKPEDYTKTDFEEKVNDELYAKFLTAGSSCYTRALTNNWECYLHVLTHLLDQEWGTTPYDSTKYPGKTKTSNGMDVDILWKYISEAGISKTPLMIPVSEAVCNTDNPDTTYYTSGLMGADLQQGASVKDQLYSDFYYDAEGNLQKKLLKQKVIDMYYIIYDCERGGNTLESTSDEMQALLASFQEDMKLKKKVPVTVPDTDAYKKAHDDWEKEGEKITYPNDVDFTETITTIKVDAESEEGQWYINLWHRMNGPSIFKATINGVDNGAHDGRNDGVIDGDNVFAPTNGRTENGKVLWTVLEDGLMNSPEWLQYALDNGYATLERVDYTNPTEYGTGLKYYTWDSIIYSNAADITEQVNEAAITKAEVKYQQTVRDIESKDKAYDNILKRLDTEHNALQTEYDSVKNVINKNIERTLKLYS